VASVQILAAADLPSTAPKKNETVLLLKQKNYRELDKRLANVQKAFDQGLLSDEQLLDTFRAFYDTDPLLEANYNEWIEKYPVSYPARLARGIYYKYVGIWKRGEDWIRNVKPEQLREMRSYFEKAMQDLQASVELEKKPILSYQHMMGIGTYLGMPEMNRKLLDDTIRVHPKNFVVRRRYMYALQARWGGGAQEMAAFLDECRKAKLPESQLNQLELAVIADSAWTKEMKQDHRGALQDYDKVIKTFEKKLVPLDSHEYTQALIEAGRIHSRLKEYKEALPYWDKVAQANPSYETDASRYWFWSNHGFALMQAGRNQEALKDFLKAAGMGDPWAQNQLGKLYWYGTIVKKDNKEAIKWFEQAAKQGFVEGQNNLRDAKAQTPTL